MRAKRGTISKPCISLVVCGSSSGYNGLMDPPPRFCAQTPRPRNLSNILKLSKLSFLMFEHHDED